MVCQEHPRVPPPANLLHSPAAGSAPQVLAARHSATVHGGESFQDMLLSTKAIDFRSNSGRPRPSPGCRLLRCFPRFVRRASNSRLAREAPSAAAAAFPPPGSREELTAKAGTALLPYLEENGAALGVAELRKRGLVRWDHAPPRPRPGEFWTVHGGCAFGAHRKGAPEHWYRRVNRGATSREAFV